MGVFAVEVGVVQKVKRQGGSHATSKIIDVVYALSCFGCSAGSFEPR